MTSSIRLSTVLALVLGLLLVFVASATADVPSTGETVHVFNTNGTPLADVSIYDRTTRQVLATTDGNGVSWISIQENCWDFGGDTVPQDQQCGSPNQYEGITAIRDPDDSGDPCTTGPENWPGVGFPLYGWGYGNINVTLPTVPGAPYQPSLSNEERGLLGVINRSRAEDDMAPLTVSATLTASADKYLGSVPTRKLDYGQEAIYCENSGPGIRAADAGFPTSQGIGESVLQGDGNAAAAFADLQNDPHQDALENSSATLIGIAQEGGTWVLDTSDLQTNSPYYARAADTGDAGDPDLVAAEFPSTPPNLDPGDGDNPRPTKSPRDSHLRLGGLSVKGKTVHVTVTLSAKAKGTVRAVAVAAARKKSKIVLDASRRNSSATVSGRLLPGTWLIKVRFVPTPGTHWDAATVTRRVTIHRHRRG